EESRARPDKDVVAKPGAGGDVDMGHDADALPHAHQPLDGRAISAGAEIAHRHLGADHRVVPALEVIANADIGIDDRALAHDAMAADRGRTARGVVAEADGNVWLDDGVLANIGGVKSHSAINQRMAGRV